MNTKQMIVLWYAGLASVWALLVYADSQMGYGSKETFPILPVLVCIAIVSGLLFATFRASEQTDQKKILLYFLGPPTVAFTVVIGIAGAVTYFSDDTSDSAAFQEPNDQDPSVSVDEVEMVDPCLRFEEVPFKEKQLAIFTGRIRNLYGKEIESVSVNVQVHRPTGKRLVF